MLEKIRAATAANRTFFFGIVFFLIANLGVGVGLVLFPDMPYMLYMFCLYVPAIVGFGSVSLVFTIHHKKTLPAENPIRASQVLKVIPLVLCGNLAMLPINMLSMIINERVWGPQFLESANSVPMPTSTGLLLVSIVLFALLPAVFEEWLFRGILQRANTPNLGKWVPLYTAVAFGLMHSNLITNWSLIVIGWIISMLMYRTGSLKLCMWYHFLHNTFALSLGFLSNKMLEMWGEHTEVSVPIAEQVGVGSMVIYFVVGIGAFFGAWFLLKSMQIDKGAPMDPARKMNERRSMPPQWVAPVLYLSEEEQKRILPEGNREINGGLYPPNNQPRLFERVNYVWYGLALGVLLGLALLTAVLMKFSQM